MTIKTLITIEELLQKDVEEKKKHYDKIQEKLKTLERANAYDPEDHHVNSELEEWGKRSLESWRKWTDAIEAQKAFGEHDWR